MVQTHHQSQRVSRNWSSIGRCGCTAADFDGNKRTECVFAAIEVHTLGLRKPLFQKIMRFQDEADTDVAGCVSDTDNVTAGGSVDHCTGNPLAAEIEDRSNSNTPIESLPAGGPVGCRNRRLLGNCFWSSGTVDSRFGGSLRTAYRLRISWITASGRCLRRGNFNK